MPELRQNAVTKSWVVIATERAKRPAKPSLNFCELDLPEHDEQCFFCWGNEYTTPPEVYSYRLDDSEPDTPGWLIRVITNKYGALNLDGTFNIQELSHLHKFGYAKGVTEVLIETNKHSSWPSRQSLSELSLVLKTYVERYKVISKEEQIKYILIFRNNGALGGASIEHPHSQIIAIPIVPPSVLEELEGAKDFYLKQNKCIFCEELQQELAAKTRIVYENDLFVSLEPYASRVPFETLIIPKFHSARFENLDDQQINSLSEVWKATLYKLDAGLENPPYNYFVHTAPTQQSVDDYYHWHLEILPKLTITAGFELGSGVFINITIPEECADFLREIEITSEE